MCSPAKTLALFGAGTLAWTGYSLISSSPANSAEFDACLNKCIESASNIFKEQLSPSVSDVTDRFIKCIESTCSTLSTNTDSSEILIKVTFGVTLAAILFHTAYQVRKKT